MKTSVLSFAALPEASGGDILTKVKGQGNG